MAFSILETPNISVDSEMTDKFRTAFAYDEKETLLGCVLIFAPPRTRLLTRSFRFSWIYIQTFTSFWKTIYLNELFLFQVQRSSSRQNKGQPPRHSY
jgi:hypothetical protein